MFRQCVTATKRLHDVHARRLRVQQGNVVPRCNVDITRSGADHGWREQRTTVDVDETEMTIERHAARIRITGHR